MGLLTITFCMEMTITPSRRLPLAIPTNERPLIAVERPKPAGPLPAKGGQRSRGNGVLLNVRFGRMSGIPLRR